MAISPDVLKRPKSMTLCKTLMPSWATAWYENTLCQEYLGWREKERPRA